MDMNTKLAQISEVMSDGYHFLQMREQVTTWEQDALMGDADAQRLIDLVSRFHRLCLVVTGK